MLGVITDLKNSGFSLRDLFKNDRKRKLDFSPNLYLGNGIDPQSLDKLKKRLCKKPMLTSVCLLVLSENESDQLDIIYSKQLAQEVYGDHLLRVAGMARTKEEACFLVTQIVEDCLVTRKDCALKEFLSWQS